MSLLTALIVKNTSNFGLNLLYFFKKTCYTKLERLSIQNLDLIERSGKSLSSKSNFSTFFQINCSNFNAKLYHRP